MVKVNSFNSGDFQNVFDFPDFIEMRPLLRAAVRQVAKETLNQPALLVEVERRTTALEEQMERGTRKYQRQGGVYQNQVSERNQLTGLFTQVLQVISRRDEINQEVEDIVYAVDQTRRALLALPELVGEGKLYRDDRDRELVPGTYYDLVAHYLVRPYLKDPDGGMVPANVTKAGRDLVVRLTTYAYRDWDAYLTHQYDEQHNIKNEQGLSNQEYYDRLEQNELHYADHCYAEALADTFNDLKKLVKSEPSAVKIRIMSTDLRPLFAAHPLLRLRFEAQIKERFKVDQDGKEHVMDQPLAAIHQKYDFYRDNF